ncbi:tetratricopeptide repeat protein [Chitinophagaceae bacterium MMS25-I14]
MDTPRYRQLLQQYETQTNEQERIDTLVEMAIEVRNFDVDRASEMADDIIIRAQRAGYKRGEGRGMNLKASCYWLQGEYELGLDMLEQAHPIARQAKDRRLEARILNYYGNIYRDLGDLARALNYFENALEINEELGDEFAQSVNLTSISNLHYDLNDFDSALEYALRCLPIFERAHDTNRLITIYNTLGNIYFKQDQYGEALRYFEENLVLSEPDTASYVLTISGLGKVYYKMNDFTNAYKYLAQALEQSHDMGNAEVQIISHYYLGKLFMDEGNYQLSLDHLNASYTLADEYMRRHDMMSLHEALYMLFDKTGDIPKAFFHLKSYEQLKEDIFKQTTLNKLRNLQIRQQIELAQKEKEVAERTAQLKQQFMANMSHEIRTPMNAIVGMTRLLLSKAPQPRQMRYLQAIQQSADNLLVIINDILDLSKIEAGKTVIEQIPFSIREVVQSMRDMLLLKAEEKSIDLRVYVEPVIPPRLIGDPTRLSQILINLAGNAVKFTEKGFVAINARLAENKNGKYFINFEIMDTGIGIAADQADKIFESFTQAGTDTTRKFGGTGLGLTISKQLSNLMQGDIAVKSTLGKGTTFTVTIPFEEADAQISEEEKKIISDDAMNRLTRAKLLLVEDNEFNRMVAEDTLRELLPGITIDMAVNGAEALGKVQNGKYDIVLMDIQMPVMDGITATKNIRQTFLPPARDVKIIAMTANVLQEDVQHYYEIGMNGYVSKPFQNDELLLQMASVFDNAPTGNAGASRKEEPAPAAKEPEILLPAQITDLQFLKQLTGGNSEKMRKYIGMFLDNAPRLLQNVQQALETKDFPALKIAAHSLKPQLSYMGVKEEVSNIFLIEQTASEAVHYEKLPPLVAKLHKVCEQAFRELKAVPA